MTPDIDFQLQDRNIDTVALAESLHHPSAGAEVTFDGRIRDHNEGRRVARLSYQAYPALALTTGRAILQQEAGRHGLRRAVAVHRTGALEIGDCAVWLGVSSDHRDAAFDAARAIMQRLKYELPVWKHETYLDGDAQWVGPDATAAETGQPAEHIPHWKAQLLEIWISPGNDFRGHHGGPRGEHGITGLNEVECIAGMGLRGDRYFGYKPDFKGQVTFFDADTLDAVRREFGLPMLSACAFRRNLLVRGVNLADWVGKSFSFQGIRFEGSEECRPCDWMDAAVAPGTEAFLKSAFRGGLRARIRSNGILRVD